MRILLLLLALLLGGCSTTQKTTTISEEEAHAAIVEVLHLSGSALDSSALGSLPFTALLKEEQLHILDLDEIPLLQQRLQLWRSEVLEAYRSTARGMGEELDPLLDTLVIDDARKLVQSKEMSATSILKAQKGEEIKTMAAALLLPALSESQKIWGIVHERYEIWSRSRVLLGEDGLPPLEENPFEQLLTVFVDSFLGALEREEMLLRTTPVVKGSGSILEVFQ